MARTIDALTSKIGLERFFLYVHDFGAPVAYALALASPDRVMGLIIQNGNAHDEGLGPDWDGNKAYWADPTPENRAKLPEWLNFGECGIPMSATSLTGSSRCSRRMAGTSTGSG